MTINCQAQLQRAFDAVITHGDEPGLGIPHAQIIRIGNPVGAAIPTVSTATNLNLPNATIGVTQPPNWANLYNVFGVTIDNSGYVYFANSSTYDNFGGKSLTTFNATGQVQTPSPSVAIYKANNVILNTISSLCTYSSAATAGTIGSTSFVKNDFGLGNICNSPTAQRLYTSNLDDGKIYEINSANGKITDIFDPFTLDATGTGNIAPFGERIIGLGVNTEPDGTLRLYYSLQKGANDNEIWSVKVLNTGGFVGSDNGIELRVRQLANGWTAITDITFSNKGYMAFAERSNDSHMATAFECYGKHNAWSIPKEFVTGTSGGANAKNSNGGITYASFFNPNGATITCDSLLWNTNNYVNGNIYGGHSIPSNRLSTLPNNVSTAFIYDNNNSTTDGTVTKGNFGDIEFFDSCSTQAALNPCDDLSVIGNTDTNCCLNIELKNNFNANYISSIIISSPNLNVNSTNPSGSWGSLTTIDQHTIVASNNGIAIGTDTLLPLGITGLGKICYAGNSGYVYVYWIGNAPQYDTVCVDSIEFVCSKPSSSTCLDKVKDSIVCDKGNVVWYVQLKNMNATDTIRGVTLFNTNPDIEAVSTITNGGQPFFLIPALGPGQTSSMIPFPLSISNNASNGCFTFDGCDPKSIVNNQVQSSYFCCSDTAKHCVQIPSCNPCDGAFSISMKPDSAGNCCAMLTLNNNYLAGDLEYIELHAINGASIVNTSGWSMIPPASSTFRKIKAPGTGVPTGTYADFIELCIGGTSTAPHEVIIKYFTSDSKKVCEDTISFSQCQLAQPKCGVIVNDSIYCKDNKTYYTFNVKNNGSFNIGQIDLNIDDNNKFVVTPNIFQPIPFIPAGGGIGGPFTVLLDTINGGDQSLCLYLSAHNAAYTPTSAPNNCCTDYKAKICYPFLDCKNDGCCEFDEMQIPNGITPNGDKINDVLDIVKPAKCDSISITIFNRWGNIVYKDKNYLNNWGGTNQSGGLLPQGTYFMVIELKNGSKKGLYVDVRY